MGGVSRMDWNRLLSDERYSNDKFAGNDAREKEMPEGACRSETVGCEAGVNGMSCCDERSEFQRDIDRILFSDAFRRLGRKTQVHPLNENDHIHTRLSHSLEVASVGSSLGCKVGRFLREKKGELPEHLDPHHVGQIVHAACLAHDIGNPPFGHSGEEAIKGWFTSNLKAIDHLDLEEQSDFTKFDGNAMAVRVLLSTLFVRQGMSPTYAVLGALLKYPWPSFYDVGKPKFSFFKAEEEGVKQAAEALGLPFVEGRFARHPLAYLTEAADDICYRIIDIEDATELGILEKDFMLCNLGPITGVLDGEASQRKYDKYHFRQRNSILRTKLIGMCISESFNLFVTHYDSIMDGSFDHKKSLMDMSQSGALKVIHEVYASLRERLFLSRRKAELELGAQNILGDLLAQAVPEARRLCTRDESFGKDRFRILLGTDAVDIIAASPSDRHYKMLLLVLDYVAGMTDHYAADMGRKLQGFGV